MSYRSLLFCPDEKTARTVTQVLSELDFAVETASEPYAAVKKLADERYDALVVDCQNEQDATLLFKTARNSTQNHSSLSVAVVEGQTGVAKAFRIGANLVLTKPINIEQSKSTLRVARGLLRKNEAKLPAHPAQPGEDLSQHATMATPSISPASKPVSTTATSAPTRMPSLPGLTAQAPTPVPAPFARLEVEPEPAPAPEPAELAVLDSLPELSARPNRPAAKSLPTTKAEPIAVSSAGLGAAVAPALEKPTAIDRKPVSMPPAVTNEPIVKETPAHMAQPVPTPEFTTLNVHAQRHSEGAKKFLKIAAWVLVVAAAGYLAWEKLQPLQYLHHTGPAEVTNRAAVPSPSAAVLAPTTESAPEPQASVPDETSAAPAPAPESKVTISPPHSTPANDSTPETIAVQELPMSAEAKPTVAPKAAPLMVKPGSATPAVRNTSLPAPPAPPPLELSSADSSKATLDNLVSASAAVPRIAPRSVLVSQGISQGLLVKKVPPQYPALAVQLRKEGAVQLLATINKQGSITNVKVIGGDALLAKSAVDAVRQWKYRPYLLNGQPVDMETQITINFQAPR